ncbi:MAG: response regulator transcription factor [Oscillospiraceae bacterium]|jgi:DNA-binding response OmpR family regulator|nr:response regulator transcription factor [Oscillospiraceae bacterium]
MYRIFIVEDGGTIARVMAEELSGWGLDACRAADFSNIMSEFAALNPHLVLLDLALPFRSGFYWCSEIRKSSKVPVIFLSSAADNMNMVTALHQGADDFIAKPFDLQVLVAKVQAMLRRSYDFTSPSEIVQHRGALLDKDAATLQYDNQKIELTRNEFLILALLLDNKGKVVQRETIMRRLWDDENFIDDNTLTVNVTRLRKKLEKAGLDDFIETKKGLGYCVK